MATRFGRYLLDRRLAIGGMAEVFLGRVEGPAGFEKRVVIKRILPHHSNDQRYVNMFLDEARIAARFNHPNLVQIHELAKIQGQFCMVMEYIEGKDLETVRDLCLKLKRYMPLSVLAFVIAETAEGLQYAHDLTNEDGQPLDVVHRDVSPANVIMTWIGGIKVVDFGIAKSSESSTETESGVIKGKFSYLSPEQAAGEPLDRRSDIFSLGTILYELVTLTQCFTRASTFETLDAVVAADFTPPRKLRPDIPAELERILMCMLERSRDRRYATAVDVSRELRRFMADVGVPVANDVQRFLEELFGSQRPKPDRSYNPLASSIEVPVDDEFSNPAVVVPESTRAHLLAEAMRESVQVNQDLVETAKGRALARDEGAGAETVDLGKPDVPEEEESAWADKTVKAEPEWLEKTIRAANPLPSENEEIEDPWDGKTVQAMAPMMEGFDINDGGNTDDDVLDGQTIRATTPLPRKALRHLQGVEGTQPAIEEFGITSPDVPTTSEDAIAGASTSRRGPAFLRGGRDLRKLLVPGVVAGTLLLLIGLWVAFRDLSPSGGALPGGQSETTLFVESTPSGALLYVDGELHGPTPITVEGLAVGTVHRIGAEMVGYGRHDEVLIIESTATGVQRVGVTLTRLPPVGVAVAVGDPAPVKPTKSKPPPDVAVPEGPPEEKPQVAPEPKPPKPKPPKPPKPKRPKHGYLTLTSKPPTDVILNGRKIGSTPIRGMRLPAGSHTLQLRNGKHGLSKNVKVSLRAGESAKRDVTFGKGRVVLSVRPWADVYLGGKKLGTTPMPPLTMWEGTYELRLVNPQINAEKKVRVNVKANETAKIVHNLR